MPYSKMGLLFLGSILFVLAGTAAFAGVNEYRGFPVVRLMVNGKEVTSDIPPIIVDGRTLLPVRAVADAVGASVKWDDSTRTVILSSSQPAKLGPTYLWVDSTQLNWEYQAANILDHPEYDGLVIMAPDGLSLISRSDLAAVANQIITHEEFQSRAKRYSPILAGTEQPQSTRVNTNSHCQGHRQTLEAKRSEAMNQVNATLAARGMYNSSVHGELLADVYVAYEIEWVKTDCGKAELAAMGSGDCEQFGAWKQAVLGKVQNSLGSENTMAQMAAESQVTLTLRPLFTSLGCT